MRGFFFSNPPPTGSRTPLGARARLESAAAEGYDADAGAHGKPRRLGRDALEHGARARAARHTAGRQAPNDLDHAVTLVDKREVNRPAHAPGVHRRARRKEQAVAEGRPLAPDEPAQPRRKAPGNKHRHHLRRAGNEHHAVGARSNLMRARRQARRRSASRRRRIAKMQRGLSRHTITPDLHGSIVTARSRTRTAGIPARTPATEKSRGQGLKRITQV